MIELIDINSVRPSTYNPRESDPERLDIIEWSLKKLGWLLPIYADQNGEIISGHQRHLVAKRIGCKKIPVQYLKTKDLQVRKGINIAFNRGTNDFSRSESTEDAMKKMREFDPQAKSAALQDIPIDSDAFYPCLQAQTMQIGQLLEVNKGKWDRYSNCIAKTLLNLGVVMPIVITADLKVINGIGRLEAQAEKGAKEVLTVVITNDQAEFASAMLNYLTMDFNIQDRYRDFLRHNSFRRPLQTRKHFGLGFINFAGFEKGHDFDITKPDHKKRWIRVHGRKILDFGAGHRTETKMLCTAGLDVVPFEPYPLGQGRQVNKELGKQITTEFLEAVASGKEWTSIFISSVLNSVPFREDREHIVTLLQALSTEKTRVFVATLNTTGRSWEKIDRDYIEGGANTTQFRLSYEPGIVVGDIAKAPKVQKFHTKEEIIELFGAGFDYVDAKYNRKNVLAICQHPKPINKNKLSAAIEFEFDLPYEDGTRLGLVDEAKKAFSKRRNDLIRNRTWTAK